MGSVGGFGDLVERCLGFLCGSVGFGSFGGCFVLRFLRGSGMGGGSSIGKY